MLQLLDIRKSYTTADFTQTALDDVSISFRDNEFVAILGPSGSGKTTMLNIVGGLDHYDSGNLIIDGISTEEYKDRDWDTYRNNRIGFVFQSYNLIPHQSVLANVELALTLSGVSRSERHERARNALIQVGLEDHINKKPSQLSGGQMQRVAVARALINDPEILLADEPTGALDSTTSVQIMELLTEIAKDRLVIMVTHNPELAEKYATRTVNLRDGRIVDDSDPFTPGSEEEKVSNKEIRRTSMSFLTAIALSFNNLMTKKGRTIMTAFAGSIGIIGIAAILALANGVNNYIKNVEEETLSEYPVSIQSSGIDMTSMMVGMMGMGGEETDGSSEKDPDTVSETKTLSNMFSGIGSNDLASFKTYLESGVTNIEEYANSIQYSYDITPQIFSSDTAAGIRQVNPDNSFKALGFGSTNSSNNLMSASMSTDIFFEMLDNPEMLAGQYDVVAGRWPENFNEIILVLNSSGGISDITMYHMGLRDHVELESMVKQLVNNEDVTAPLDVKEVSYEDILNVDFKMISAADRYKYDEEHQVWVDKTDDIEYMRALIDSGVELDVVGIVRPNPDAAAGSMYAGLGYTTALTEYLMNEAAGKTIIQNQLADPARNVFTGRTFEEEEADSNANGLDMNSLFSIDESAISQAFSFDTSALNMSGLSLDGLSMESIQAPPMDIAQVLGTVNVDVDQAEANTVISAVLNDYLAWVMVIEPDPTKYADHIADYFADPTKQGFVMGQVGSIVDIQGVEDQVQAALQNYMGTVIQAYTAALMTSIENQMVVALSNLSANMASAMNIDEAAFASAFKFNMTEQELSELMMSYMNAEENSYDNNLRKLGYASEDKPSGINIYPIDFESKAEIISILDGYNEQMENNGEEDKVIMYTDIVGTLMSSVTDIVNMISMVLVAFVAISLVVSSIMIGIITYISVLERKKEIGILRSIGASKGDISRVFNAETLIVGLVAGLLGVAITALICIPANIIIYEGFGVPDVASLPINAAVILVAISMFLSFIAGLIPSSAASRKDPVEALRSE